MQNEKYYQAEKDDYHISTNPSLIDTDVIYSYLSGESYWAKNIPRDLVEKSIANSLCFGVYHYGKQIGWTVLDEDTRKKFMQKHNKNAYK